MGGVKPYADWMVETFFSTGPARGAGPDQRVGKKIKAEAKKKIGAKKSCQKKFGPSKVPRDYRAVTV